MYIILTSRPDLQLDLNSTGQCVKLLNGHTDCLVKSDDMITFKTYNPQTHPLPSYYLLQMQWVLRRIASIRGAADSIEDDEDDEEQISEESGVLRPIYRNHLTREINPADI